MKRVAKAVKKKKKKKHIERKKIRWRRGKIEKKKTRSIDVVENDAREGDNDDDDDDDDIDDDPNSRNFDDVCRPLFL